MTCQHLEYVVSLPSDVHGAGEKLAVNLIENPLHVICLLCFQNSLGFDTSYDVSRCLSLWACPSCSSLCFLDVWIYHFHQVLEVLAIISSTILSAPFLLSLLLCKT